MHRAQNRTQRAHDVQTGALALARAERPGPEATAYRNLAMILRDLGDYTAAFAHAERALAIRRHTGGPVQIADALLAFAELHLDQGLPKGPNEAGKLCGRAHAILADAGGAPAELTRAHTLAARARPDEARRC
ncbi:tetratricopeptide repeat protein [Actinosynnema sp. NPDC050436]|uniref:tetratricopeptide repeat protein n=1 Tax=Actinosynnema sp. NPDC050436 TaxID=3155659 RepID=UPI0034109412